MKTKNQEDHKKWIQALTEDYLEKRIQNKSLEKSLIISKLNYFALNISTNPLKKLNFLIKKMLITYRIMQLPELEEIFKEKHSFQKIYQYLKLLSNTQQHHHLNLKENYESIKIWVGSINLDVNDLSLNSKKIIENLNNFFLNGYDIYFFGTQCSNSKNISQALKKLFSNRYDIIEICPMIVFDTKEKYSLNLSIFADKRLFNEKHLKVIKSSVCQCDLKKSERGAIGVGIDLLGIEILILNVYLPAKNKEKTKKSLKELIKHLKNDIWYLFYDNNENNNITLTVILILPYV